MSGCAETTPRQRPGVLEAKSCMAHLNQPLKNFEQFIIRSCTNTGVWVVETLENGTGQPISIYDFVNQDYTGPETNGQPMSLDFLENDQQMQFLSLQKSLNKALLN